MQEIDIIQKLVGNITFDDLANVDYYLIEHFGIFIPNTGFCKYAIQKNHIHPSYAFFIQLSDNGKILDGINLPKSNKNVYSGAILSPNIPHQEYENETFQRYIAIFINTEYFEQNFLLQSKNIQKYNKWFPFFVSKDIIFFLEDFMQEYEEKKEEYINILDSLAYVIMHKFIRNILSTEKKEKITTINLDIQIIVEYMQQNFAKKITIKELSNKINMTEATFIRNFKKEMNMSPIQYLIQTRLQKAQKYIRIQQLNLSEIAFSSGFNSLSHFTTCFKQHYNITPSKYKKMYDKNLIE